MASNEYDSWQPISVDTDETLIATMLEDANVPTLIASLVHLSGDTSVLHGAMRLRPDVATDIQCGLSTEEQARVRAMALDAVRAYREGGGQMPPPLSPQAVREIMDFLVCDTLSQDYVHFLMTELELDGDDAFGQASIAKVPVAKRRAFHAVIVGAGMSGLLAAYRLKEAQIPFTIVERRPEVGGTWVDNAYPGCRVDNATHTYEYSFARRDWPQYYCTQPVLREYFQDCASQFELHDNIRFNHEVEGASLDERTGLWSVRITGPDGVTEVLQANVLISAVGQLNQPRLPDIAGREDFTGPAFHSARWNADLDLTGKRIGVIGTGGSAVQFVPEIAESASEVLVFQRTPPWIGANEVYRADVTSGEHWLINHLPFYAKWYQFLQFWLESEGMLSSVVKDSEWPEQDESISAANDTWRRAMIDNIESYLGVGTELAASATPGYAPGGKRLLWDDGIWYRTLAREDVQVITDPIAQINASGIATESGAQHDVDVIIYGTGFHSTRFLWPMAVEGRNGVDLREHWGDDPRAYLGVVVPGFPNLFCLYGPNTNIVVNGSTIFFSECGMRYILGCIALMLAGDHQTLECRKDVHDAYNELIDAGNLEMAWGAPNVRSWYKNKAGRVVNNWPFTLLEYWNRTQQTDPTDFELA